RMYPVYGFDKNKGYGTRQHLEALKRYGPCPVHRLTFKRVRQD
ncbi:MAG: ribonuclease HII, partial [Desulfobacteraceae bacterium]|nr:ribonuclease HII [Desulfobacteraceae bacterium]